MCVCVTREREKRKKGIVCMGEYMCDKRKKKDRDIRKCVYVCVCVCMCVRERE